MGSVLEGREYGDFNVKEDEGIRILGEQNKEVEVVLLVVDFPRELGGETRNGRRK